ncbi:MAG: type IV pilin-like G/H family protein [Cyanobacteria bacterium P01_D01_bin.116]
MKTELKAKFLQNILSKKKENEGFTLIELLVVIIIIGILSAIALPAFLNQANKARASEAKTYVGSINRAQQAYFLENPAFVIKNDDFAKLELGIKTQTENYVYTLAEETTIAGATVKAVPVRDTAVLKGYIGGVGVGSPSGKDSGEATTLAILCETNAKKKNGDTLASPEAEKDGDTIINLKCTADQKSLS